MESDEKARKEAEEPEATADDDTEAHSLGVVMAMNQILGGDPKSAKRTYRRDADEEIRPINKSFPRMRDDKRR
jgi:hypothetical protein